jgi:hypothetical protein
MANDTNDSSNFDLPFGPPPRAWLYDLAHRFMSDIFTHPDFLKVIDDQKRLRDLVELAVEFCALEHEEPLEAEVAAVAEGIAIHRRVHAEGACIAGIVVFELPPPLFATECYFVAVAFLGDDGSRYFTLERKEQNSSRTMFCAWDRQGRHLNYGEGPPPDVDSFVQAIGHKLCRGEPSASIVSNFSGPNRR